MNITEALQILVQYNKWRRSDKQIDMLDPKRIGEAIDVAIKVLEKTVA